MKVLKYILKTFDYVYYRTYRWYENKKDSMPNIKAIGVVSIMVFLLLSIILVCVSIVISFNIPKVHKAIVAVIYLMVLGVVLRRYSRMEIGILDLRWRDENPAKKKKRGWMIFLFLVGELLFIIISSYIRHNVLGDANFFK